MAAAGPGSALGEDAEPRPVSHYGCSKLEAERVVRALVPDAVIARPPVVYGPRDTDVYQVLKSVAKGIALEISGPQRWFSAIYVGDLADALCEPPGTRGPPGALTISRIPSPSPGAIWPKPRRASWGAGRRA